MDLMWSPTRPISLPAALEARFIVSRILWFLPAFSSVLVLV